MLCLPLDYLDLNHRDGQKTLPETITTTNDGGTQPPQLQFIQGQIQVGNWDDCPPKTMEITSFTMVLHN